MTSLLNWLRHGGRRVKSTPRIPPHGKVLTASERFGADTLARIEAKYEAKYVCETCLRDKRGGWVNSSVSIFYQPDASKVPEGGSQWFGLFFTKGLLDESRLMICNAITAVEEDIIGIVADNGDVIYSRFRHDYRWSPDKSVMIDGGRDYDRHNMGGPLVTLRIVEDHLCIIS